MPSAPLRVLDSNICTGLFRYWYLLFEYTAGFVPVSRTLSTGLCVYTSRIFSMDYGSCVPS